MEGASCTATPNCTGVVEGGYCTVCGRIANPTTRSRPNGSRAGGGSRPASGATSRPGTAGSSSPTGPARPSRPSRPSRRESSATRLTTARSRIGAGLVSVPPMPSLDPAQAVLADPHVPEEKRFCTNCGAEVGRTHDGRAGRITGFCSKCRQPYSFVPPLRRGDLVAGQYRVAGCLAYGGLGWIYVAQDVQLANRWVVLKGLLNTRDPDAMAAAVAERQFLARVEHPNVVRVYNFVQHEGAGYTVMEYVGGKTMRDVLLERRRANGSGSNPLPVELAIAYLLGILPAFGYLHRLGLVYNDFKPDNVMLHGDDVRLIDLGAVTRMDDTGAAVYGTDGYQAPEVARLGPSVASDLYSIGRCLAVLIMDFRGYQTKYRFSLPDLADQPVLSRHESVYRFLAKSTAENPDERFQSADEMAEQLLGVLREVVAARDGVPRPAVSTLFGADLQSVHRDADASPVRPDWRYLPSVKVNAADAAASFVVDITALSDPVQQVNLLREAIERGQVADTAEARFALARALIWMGQVDEAERHLDAVNGRDPWDWRVSWYRGVRMLRHGMAAEAREAFRRCTADLPGELAPKLGEALAAELAGDLEQAARLYQVIATTDPGYTTACFGLARVQEALGNRAAAVDAYRRIPDTSSLYVAARIALARTLFRRTPHAEPGVTELTQASATLERLRLDGEQRTELAIELLDAALGQLRAHVMRPEPSVLVLGHPLEETSLQRGLEQAYRDRARTADGRERIRFVDLANAVRPRTRR